MLNFNQLFYFKVICETKTLEEAAQILHLSQPALSKSMKNLEETYGIALFLRKTRSHELTPEGNFLYYKAKKILEEVHYIEKQLHHFNQELTLGVPPMIGNRYLAEIMHFFKENYPNLKMKVIEGGSLEIRHQMEERKLDLALAIVNRFQSNEVYYQVFKQTELKFLTYPSHPKASCSKVDLNSIKDEALILLKDGSFQLKELSQWVGKENDVMETSQITLLKKLVKEQVASGFIIENLLEEDPQLKVISLNPPFPIEIGLLTHQDDLDSRPFLKKVYQELFQLLLQSKKV